MSVEEQEALTPEEEFDKANKEQEDEEIQEDALKEGLKEGQDTSPSEVSDGSPAEEKPSDPEKYDEGGVLWKNRAKEFERKYNKGLEQIASKPEAEKPLSDEEMIEKVAEEYGLSTADVPGFVKLAGKISARMLEPLQMKIDNYEFQTLKDAAKREVAKDKPDFTDLSIDIEEELKDLSAETKTDSGRLKTEIEKAYWIAKGKKSSDEVKKAETRVKKKTEEEKKVISSQPEGTRPGKVSAGDDKLSEQEAAAAENMGIPADEYLKYKKKVRKR